MSANNGVIRIGRKGIKKFAFGENGEPFEVDVVVAYQKWINIDEGFRNEDRVVESESIPRYHEAAVNFAKEFSEDCETTAEALDFIARLCEQYNELASFFQPKSPEKRGSPATSETELRFSVEENLASSTN